MTNTKEKKLVIYTDGGARGNPGPAASGVVIFNDQKKMIGEYSKFLGETTNNQAEYRAVLLALEKALELEGTEIVLYSDSELIVNQLNRKYKVKNKELSTIFVKIWNIAQKFDSVSYHHVPREKNKLADAQVNECLDQYLDS
ncbi:ribonuclease HI family protein [Patescibacteria group bacterium]|nr:ribonuclease HI family protein [Patescibacteria group bacterium]MBU1075402.1 ribonuclease HI family protein [Patescibacteria group bacterium]MBU1952449.1 ribonuclease HI family protein [Patescibacteria group bacterium]MBU2228899.1 ribonuclease HI family protein [Patescibacteria group bacterium]MBU2236020.1 ribonuclease HI family protein [Patescibacteria group bacterium]